MQERSHRSSHGYEGYSSFTVGMELICKPFYRYYAKLRPPRAHENLLRSIAKQDILFCARNAGPGGRIAHENVGNVETFTYWSTFNHHIYTRLQPTDSVPLIRTSRKG